MTTLDLVKECLISLHDRKGSSLPAINNWIESEKHKAVKKHVMKAALKSGVEKGDLVPVRHSYKISADAKKLASKKNAPKTKKAVTVASKKKTVAKKKNPEKKRSAAQKHLTMKKAKTAPKKTKITVKKAGTAPKETKAAPSGNRAKTSHKKRAASTVQKTMRGKVAAKKE